MKIKKWKYNIITLGGSNPDEFEKIAKQLIELLENGAEIVSKISMINGVQYIVRIKKEKDD